MNPRKLNTGKALWLVLIVLTIIDMAFCTLEFILAAKVGWPLARGRETALESAGKLIIVIWLLQLPLRLVALACMAFWTARLVHNAKKIRALSISVRWAWLSYFVPIASYWLPAKMLVTLNNHKARPLVVSWWIARLFTCVTGGAILAAIAAVPTALIHNLDGSRLSVNWLGWLALAGIFADILAVMILLRTQRVQSANDPAVQVF